MSVEFDTQAVAEYLINNANVGREYAELLATDATYATAVVGILRAQNEGHWGEVAHLQHMLNLDLQAA